MRQLWLRHWFLLCLVLVLCLGFGLHQPLHAVGRIPLLRDGIVFAVLFAMALPLPARTIWRALRSPTPALLAIAVSFGMVPLLAWCGAGLLPGTLGPGLIVAAATPCTVASAAVWTRKAGGNDAVAILVTLITNLSCFAATPALVFLYTGQQSASIELGPLIGKLAVLVCLPLVLAQLLRCRRDVAAMAARNKNLLSTAAQIGILAMVGIGSLRTGGQLWELIQDRWQTALLSIGGMTLLASAIHVAALLAGWHIARMIAMGRAERIAVAIAGSQKTLLIGLSVAIEMQVSILPIIAYHVSQLVIDTLFAHRWAASAALVDHPKD